MAGRAARVLSLAATALWVFVLSPCAWSDDEGIESTAEEEATPRMSAAEAGKAIAETLPAGASKEQQVAFYARREKAAFALGRGDLRIDALKHLVELTGDAKTLSPYASYLWRETWRSGNQSEALALGEQLADDKRATPMQRVGYAATLANDYANLGDMAKARAGLARIEADLAKAKDPPYYVRIMHEHLRGSVLQAEGDLAGAEAANKRSLALVNQEVAETRPAAARGSSVDYDRAVRMRFDMMQRSIRLSLAQGKSEEAEATARTGLSLAESEKTLGATAAFWQAQLARAKLGERRYAEARDASAKAVEALIANGTGPTSERVINTQGYLMQALFGLEQWAQADRLNGEMIEATASDAVARRLVDSAPLQAFLHLRNGRLEPALQRIDGSVRFRTVNYGEGHPLTIESKAIRAMIHQAQGRTSAALDDYRAVFRAIFAPETSFADAQPPGLRGYYVPSALRAYLELVAKAYRESGGKLRDPELVADSFRVADRLRASVVQQALIDSASRSAASTPALTALIRREQDQRARMRELFGTINHALEEERRAVEEFREKQKTITDREAVGRAAAAERERTRAAQAEIRGKREALVKAQDERAAVMREIGERFPDYQSLVNPKPATPRDIAKLLRNDEALVSIFATRAATFVWTIPAGGEVSLHVASVGTEDLKKQVAKLRSTLDIGEKLGAGSISAFDAATSAKLYADVLAPAVNAAPSAKTLIFVVNGELAQLPFATFVTSAPSDTPSVWLVRRAAIAQVSSVAAFQALRQSRKHARAAQPFAGFGDPPMNYASLPPLPETRREILAIAKSLGANPDRDTFLGPRASRQAVLTENLSAHRVVAFATHGLKPGDVPGLSRPALAMAGTDKPGESPFLVLDDVMTLKLNADWVVLSACNTASEDGRAEEALSGLARGFFFAGARSVLVTHWAVESTSAEDLTTRTFGHFARDTSISRAEALRRAQLEMADGKSKPQFTHPFFWAPYALSGDPAE